TSWQNGNRATAVSVGESDDVQQESVKQEDSAEDFGPAVSRKKPAEEIAHPKRRHAEIKRRDNREIDETHEEKPPRGFLHVSGVEQDIGGQQNENRQSANRQK